MATTITWTISQLDCKPQEDGETDVVVTAHWQCTGVDGAYNGQIYGATGFTYTPGNPFTPYDELTQEQVLEWVWDAGVNKDETEAAVETQIQNQINPPIIVPPLPWAPAPAPVEE
jgi:hypothetical protein